MTKSQVLTTFTALMLAAAGLAACGSQKEPAEAAVASIEKTLEGSGAHLEKYLPEQHAQVVERLAALRDMLAKEEYRAVVAEAPAIADQLRRSVADAAIRRANVKLEMEAEWVQLVKTMPGLIGDMDKRIAAMNRGRLPAGVDRENFKAAAAIFDGAKASWGRAAEAGNAGKLEDAVTAAREAKTAITAVQQALDIQAS